MEDAEENFNEALGQLLLQEDEIKYKVVENCPKGRFQKFNDELASSPLKVVAKAYDAEDGREVFWHILKLKGIPKKYIVKIHRDLSLMKNFKHDNIISCIDYWPKGEKKEIVFMTEMMNGGCLKSYLNKIQTTKLKVVKGWCEQILKGLAYLHELPNTVVHQSIRCDNIYINSTSNQVKLGQIGLLCTLLNPLQPLVSKQLEYIDPVQWTAPEIYEGKVGVLADIYSFGMTLLELFTGKKPYQECRTEADVYKRVSKSIKPKSLKDVPYSEIRQMIEMCISSYPSHRPSARTLLSHNFWKLNEDIDNNNVKLTFNGEVEENITAKAKRYKRQQKIAKLSQIVTKKQSASEIKFIFQFASKKRYEIKFQKQQEQSFQEFMDFLAKKFEEKQLFKEGTNLIPSFTHRFQEKEIKDDYTSHFLSCNNPTMKTMRLDLYQSRVKEQDFKKSAAQLGEFNWIAQGDALGRIQQIFAGMYYTYRNTLEHCHLEQVYQQARFILQKKELEQFHMIQKDRLKLKRKDGRGNQGFLANSSSNFIDFLNSSETPWANEAYQIEKDITLKHTLGKPQDALSLNFSSIQNYKQQTHADFQLENARYIFDQEEQVKSQKLNQQIPIELRKPPSNQQKEEVLKEMKQRQKQQQIKSSKQLFEKKSSIQNQRIEHEAEIITTNLF